MSQGESRTSLETLPLVAVGSNEEDRFGGAVAIVRAAASALELAGLPVRTASRLYHTPCFPAGNGPDFVNAAVQLDTDLPPKEILQRLHSVEDAYGRNRAQRWGPRTLDLDLIAAGDTVLPDPKTLQGWIDLPFERQREEAPKQMVIPHPRLQDRAFVLIPLAEIAPEWTHPLSGKTVAEMVNDLPDEEKQVIRPLD